MAGQNSDEIKSVLYKLPKRKSVEVISWAFVVDQLQELIPALVNEITATNVALTGINARVDEWLEEQHGGGNE